MKTLSIRLFFLIVFVGIFISTFAAARNTAILQQDDSPKPGPEDTIHIVGHAHMDMSWLWDYYETMKMCNDNLRQTVAFMEEYPDFTMVQSQASVYDFVKQVDPVLFQRVRKYVNKGRLEPVGGMWTEGDTNLSGGEALCRSFLLGQNYFQNNLGRMARVGWLPDNFGHISQLPQILNLSNIDYYYFHRCKPYTGTFWWQAPDGSKVLAYANNTYNGNITPQLENELQKFMPEREENRILHITGVGDHGGGPTRKNIEMIHNLDNTEDYPAVKFTTAEEFFKKSAREMENRPTHRGEMQFIFEGCYTTVHDIKEGNRKLENTLYRSEFFNTLHWLEGNDYPGNDLRDSWETLVFNEFHDILPGSGIHEANEENVARYNNAIQKARLLGDKAFHRMADMVDFQNDLGQPVVAYNLQPRKRKAIVEAEVFSHDMPAPAELVSWGNYYGTHNVKPKDIGQGKFPSVLVRDASGETYPAQIVEGKSTPPGYTSKVRFVADNLPAGGYKTFYVDMTKPGKFNESLRVNDSTFHTEFFRVTFNMNTGNIVSLYDKRSGKEYVEPGGELNQLRMYQEDKNGGMKAWYINKIVKEEDITDVESVEVTEEGPVRACVKSVKTWGKSRFIERTYLYRSYPRIEYDMELRWLETGSDSTHSPMLRATFPIQMENPRFYNHVPFDVVERPIDGKLNGKPTPDYVKHRDVYGIKAADEDGQEVPAQHWADLTDGSTGIALLNNSKYGHSVHEGKLRLTLMRAAGEPDLYPNLGKFNIRYALYPHSGDWKNGVWREGEDFNVPVYAAEPPSSALAQKHATQPEEASFISLDAPGVVLSGMKKAEEGDELIVRVAETEGSERTTELTLPVNVQSAHRLNLVEMPLEKVTEPSINGKTVRFDIEPHEIVTLGISWKR